VFQSRNGRPASQVEGRVEANNGTGIRIDGEWFNRSKFHPVDLPQVGSLVSLDVDDKGFIRKLEVLGDEDLGADRFVSVASATRLSVLQAAAACGASRPDMKSGDVLKIADVWLAWVEQD